MVYLPPPTPITFTINQKRGNYFYNFTCEKGMTWDTFINSEYNTPIYENYNGRLFNVRYCKGYNDVVGISFCWFDYGHDGHDIDLYRISTQSGSYVNPNDIIMENHVYVSNCEK